MVVADMDSRYPVGVVGGNRTVKMFPERWEGSINFR